MTRYASLYERLVANTTCDNECGCWIWTGGTRRHGNGERPAITMRVPGRRNPVRMHACRVMLGLFYVLDDEAEASHLCSHSWLCIHPDHLMPETQAQNLARRWKKPVPAARTWPTRSEGDPDLWVRHAPALRPLTECPF